MRVNYYFHNRHLFGKRLFPFPERPDRLWPPPHLLFNVHRASSATAKRPGREVDHSPPSSGDVKNEWTYTPTPPTCPHGMDREKYYVYHYCCLALSLATRIQFQVCFTAQSQATVTAAFRSLPHFLQTV